eukprot:TRINITY_DN14122_c0_g1_i1.p1 TRINITY_DN14122_c0_g1~~TRINITY_DN14122_c0_g1_i1.p1  ORF type:complete len:259 (+),score=52.61 TRINITY_DN14122_c0_g1_i1:71-778(+)
MEFDIQEYKQRSGKKREVMRRFRDKLNDSSELNISSVSSSSRKEQPTKDKIEEFFRTQRRTNSIVNPASPKTFLKQFKLSEGEIKSRAKNGNKFEEMLDSYFSTFRLGAGESERTLGDIENRTMLKSPYRQRNISTRTDKSPIVAFREQYYDQKSEAGDKKEPLSPFQTERSFLNKSRTINAGDKFDMSRMFDYRTSRPPQYRNAPQKLTYPDIQAFQKKIDSMSEREMASLPPK